MPIRPILRYPNMRLRTPTITVGAVDDDVRKLVQDLTDTMYGSDGVGLAAVQLGDPRKVFVVDGHATLQRPAPIVFINPEITWLSPETEMVEEGCLSFPQIYIQVKRAVGVRVRYTDLDGNRTELDATGLFSQAIQHENDHLTSKLLIDHAGALRKQAIERKLTRRR